MSLRSSFLLSLALAGCTSTRARDASAPTLRLDHPWIATPTGAAAERAALERAGFRIAPATNRHDGQGTASVTVELENGFLELIYADPGVPVSGEGGAIAQRRFTERGAWRTTDVSPFGVAVRRTQATPSVFPFETWRVSAAWMEPGTSMEMLTPRGSRATNVAIHPHGTDEAANLRAIAAGGEAAWRFDHPNGARRITALAITAPDEGGVPPCAAFVNESGALELRVARGAHARRRRPRRDDRLAADAAARRATVTRPTAGALTARRAAP